MVTVHDNTVQPSLTVPEPNSGSIKIGDTVSISYVDQSRGGIDPKKNVWEVVSDGLDYLKVGKVEMPSRAYVSAFGFKGPDQQKPAGVLSGGERNRLNLALTLKIGGNLLLLDEPTNDLDVETLQSLENALLEFPGCAVITSHDRWFLDAVAGQTGGSESTGGASTGSGDSAGSATGGTPQGRTSTNVTTPSANATPPQVVGEEFTIIEGLLVGDPDLQRATFGWLKDLDINACVLGLSQSIRGS